MLRSLVLYFESGVEFMKKILPLALVLFGLAHLTFSQKTNESEQQPPAIKLEPNSIDFGDQVAKKPSKSQRITVTNTGGKKLYINSVVISGDERQDFAVVQDTCTGATIDSSKSCIVDVSFTPSATDSRNAAIVLTDNASDSPQKVPLTGKGINSAAVRPSGDKQQR
ncbi:MAG: choice-of-anchor D domain-containing protein [Acidobacteriota bacterium]